MASQSESTSNMDLQLQATFEEFKRSKSVLRQIHDDTLECFKKIEETLGSHKHGQELAHELATEITMGKQAGIDESMVLVQLEGLELATTTTTASLADTLYTKEEQEDVTALFSESPALIVVGQTNSGKSSIINEILGCRIVSTSDQPCTSRIVKLTHSTKNYVHLVRSDGAVMERHEATDMKIPREMIELKENDRENHDRVTATIEAGFDINFLKSGVNIIDSPGRDENKILDKLVREQLKNTLPFIVYVIDGKNLFTALDKSVLEEITERNKDLEIFFVISKIEPQAEDSSGEEDEDEDEEDEVETVQDNKKRRVFEQLVKNGFLSPDENSMHDHEYFHGLSAWKLNDFRRKKKKNPQWNDPGDVYKEYVDAFERFQSCLKTFSDSSLKACVKRSCHTLISVLSRCLYFFIEKANALKETREANISMLNKIQEEEALVHRNIALQVEKQREEIISVMTKAIADLEEHVTKEAVAFQYSEEFVIPAHDGFVTGAEAVNQCRKQIEQMVFNNVHKRMKQMLQTIFHSRDTFIEDLEERVRKIEKEASSQENHESTDASTTLHSNLVWCYEVNPKLKISWSLKKMLTAFQETLKRFARKPLATLRGKIQVGDPEWKTTVAVDTLQAIQISVVANDMVTNLKEHFQSCHTQFIGHLNNILRVLKRGGTLKDDQRGAILQFAPDVASLEMLCHSVNDKLKFGRPRPGEMIGAGAQGNVFTCTNILTPEGKPCVVKVVPVSGEGLLKDLTLELHTTRSLNHPNILPIVCTAIEPDIFKGIRVSIVSERMKSDLQHALKTIPSLRARLMILLDVGVALQYLHHKDLMHRDVKLQNVLVDDNNRGYLTDFGLCKPVGLATNSLVGTPIAMAPEMIESRYGKSVDVYAFGILMWRVCEGQGNQPKNIILFPVPLIMIALNAAERRKPEQLDSFHLSCWALMEKCWETNPERRPSFDEIVGDLQQILADTSID